MKNKYRLPLLGVSPYRKEIEKKPYLISAYIIYKDLVSTVHDSEPTYTILSKYLQSYCELLGIIYDIYIRHI